VPAMTIDRKALASDLESLGIKALAWATRKGTVSLDRALDSVKRLQEQSQRKASALANARPGTKAHLQRTSLAKRAARAQEVLERYQGDEGT
jgi:hypothetical protein